MELSEKDIELIDNYTQGRLTESNRTIFEERKKDPNFKEELNFRIDLAKAAKSVGRDKNKELLMDVEKNLNPKYLKKSRQNKWLKLFLIIVTTIALVAVINWYIERNMDKKIQFTTFYSPYPNVVAPIQRGVNTELIDNPFQLYEKGEYEKAIKVFNSRSVLSEADQFYLALSLLYNHQKDQAKQELESIITNSSHEFLLPSKWYLSQIYLEKEDYGKAKIILQEIVKNDANAYQLKALELIELLKNK